MRLRKSREPRNYHKKRRMMFEGLENRRMMDGGISAAFTDGVLAITGTEAADRIVVRQVDAQIRIEGLSEYYPASIVENIRVDALGGDDIVRIQTPEFMAEGRRQPDAQERKWRA